MFTKRSLQFLENAGRAKSRDWLDQNRDRYDRDIKAPFAALLAALDERFREELPHFRFSPRSLSRPTRQPGRGAGRPPLKDYVACFMGPRKSSRFEFPVGFYLSVSSAEIFFAAGLYRPSSQQLRRIRTELQNDAEPLAKLLARKRFKDLLGPLAPDDMTRPPRGFAVPPKYQHLLMKRSFTVRRDFTLREFTSSRFAREIIASAEAAIPFVAWLESATASPRI